MHWVGFFWSHVGDLEDLLVFVSPEVSVLEAVSFDGILEETFMWTVEGFLNFSVLLDRSILLINPDIFNFVLDDRQTFLRICDHLADILMLGHLHFFPAAGSGWIVVKRLFEILLVRSMGVEHPVTFESIWHKIFG